MKLKQVPKKILYFMIIVTHTTKNQDKNNTFSHLVKKRLQIEIKKNYSMDIENESL
jgi:hypothetical protein